MSDTRGRQRITRELLFGAFVGPQSDADDPRIRERIMASIEERVCAPGDTLYIAGEEAHHVHFMTDGRVRLARRGQADWVYEGQWVIGTTDVLLRRPRARTATVETATRTFRLPSDYWFNVMQDKPAGLLNTVLGYVRGSIRYITMLAPGGGFEARAEQAPYDGSTLTGRMRALEQPRLLAGLPAQLLLELATAAEERALAPGQALFTPGSPRLELAVVLRGRLEAHRAAPDIRATFGPGEMVGGPVCIGDTEGVWEAQALETSSVLTLPVETMYDALEDHADGLRAFMASFALEQERLCEVLAERRGELVLV